jgi:tetratricopeptide (TPR) repeat protein
MARLTHYSKSLIGHLETGRRGVNEEHVDAYRRALGVEVTAALPDVEQLRSTIGELVEADVRGDGEPSEALRLFRVGQQQAASAAPSRDLHAVVGELGEVAGWMLYEAGRHDEMRSTNLEALHLSRLAGDRSIELLTLQNMSMHAGDLGQPGESLSIARMALEAPLSPRLEALFRTREARALAQLGDAAGARQTFRRARSLFMDGSRDDDPGWAWWITDQELLWHDAMIAADSGDLSAAIDMLQSAIDITPAHERRRLFNSYANLALLQARAGLSQDAGSTLAVCDSYRDVRSVRSETTRREALRLLCGRAG